MSGEITENGHAKKKGANLSMDAALKRVRTEELFIS